MKPDEQKRIDAVIVRVRTASKSIGLTFHEIALYNDEASMPDLRLLIADYEDKCERLAALEKENAELKEVRQSFYRVCDAVLDYCPDDANIPAKWDGYLIKLLRELSTLRANSIKNADKAERIESLTAKLEASNQTIAGAYEDLELYADGGDVKLVKDARYTLKAAIDAAGGDEQ